MNKLFISFVVVLALLFGGWYWYVGQGPQAVSPLDAGLYPLYAGASWGEAQEKVTADGPAYGIVSAPFIDITNIAQEAMPFTKYYDDKLVAAGWSRDMMREAGGAGAGVSFYTKGDQFIVVSFHSIFKVKHPDAPSECPCDLTLSLMSGTQVGPTPAEQAALRVYRDEALGFSLTLPTPIAPSASDSQYGVDTTYEYTAQGPAKSIAGVKFTIPKSRAAGTNLSSDSYISVEHMPSGACDAAAFMSDTSAKSRRIREGVLSYSVASSTDAAVGNRYEETVYALVGSSPCIAVRYFIHYGAIENFPQGEVKEFDKAALLEEFDQIRRTLAIAQ